jgi:hypothetical protein
VPKIFATCEIASTVFGKNKNSRNIALGSRKNALAGYSGLWDVFRLRDGIEGCLCLLSRNSKGFLKLISSLAV